MNILFTAFEAAPFIKTGGLGDVAGSLPYYIKASGHDIRLILPLHSAIPKEMLKKAKLKASFEVKLSWRNQYCGLFEMKKDDLTIYFIDNEYYFKREGIYGHFDDAERVAFFSKAVLESVLHIKKFNPDIIHCNDWHTALTPVYLKSDYYNRLEFSKTKTIFTIHNIKFQGKYPEFILGDVLGLWGRPGIEKLFQGETLNFLKGASYYSDAITTVSPTYANEICTMEYGEGLQDVFIDRKDALYGILNGIDENQFCSYKDEHLDYKFRKTSLEKKTKNKLNLQKEFGLEDGADIPLFVIISRLTDQKGLDLVRDVMHAFVEKNVQLLVLGVGERHYEEMFLSTASCNAKKIAVKLAFDSALSHRMYGSADVLLMPSKFEPCGLAQMMAMRYGTLPLVRRTGGLKDSVKPYFIDKENANGFGFDDYNPQALFKAIERCLDVYHNDKETWKTLVLNAMNTHFDWKKSAKEYIKLYERVLGI